MYCEQCGLCCQHLNQVDIPEEYKQLDRGDGVCKYLKNNLCSIYKDRPLLCNSEKMYQLYYYKKYETMEDFETFLLSECKKIQERENERLCKNNECV